MTETNVEAVDNLLGTPVPNTADAMQWMSDVWAYFLETGLYFAGGPAGPDARNRLRLVERAGELAKQLDDPAVSAEAYRITGHVMNAAERYPEAVDNYRLAIPALAAVGREEDAARTRLGYTAALMHTGQYQEAMQVIQEADDLFQSQGDVSGHARALVNKANIHHRLDEHQLAVDSLMEAARIFSDAGQTNELAAVTINIANSLSVLMRFDASENYYERAEEIARAAGLDSVVDQAGYNRAYLQFLRGRYSDAILAFNSMRRQFHASGSTRHAALCDLDESEVYLNLNLGEDAAALAQRARGVFASLEMAYEQAKATVFEAVGRTLMLKYQEALDLFAMAEKQFLAEDNSFWLGMIELYRAGVLLAMGRLWEARFQAEGALQRFDAMNMPYQEGMALVVLGRVALLSDDNQALEEYTRRLIRMIESSKTPLLDFPAYMLCAESAERSSQLEDARRYYVAAAETLENHRNFLHHDELRVRYLEGKDKVFESLVSLELMEDTPASRQRAFEWCEQAKARALAELLGQHLPVVKSDVNAELLGHINQLREALNSQYTLARPDNEGQLAPDFDFDTAERELENNLRTLADVDDNFSALMGIGTPTLDDISSALGDDTTLVEFFTIDGEVLAFIVSRDQVLVRRRLTSTYQVEKHKKSLDFQMKKFALGDNFVVKHLAQMTSAAESCLAQLHQELVAPWLSEITTRRLAIVPHGELHGIPFHALFDQETDRYLVDLHDVFYVPSGDVMRLVSMREPLQAGNPGLLIGLADEVAPAIADEISRLRTLMPRSQVFEGEVATSQALFDHGAEAGFIHIACHAMFRRDNPMFSCFELADRAVTALDLFGQSWPCELVTLSGCSSGVSRIFAGDELQGLIRGLFHAGTRSVLVSQWNVSDSATLALMQSFYANWLDSGDKAAALSSAMKTVRGDTPHPFYWAPFTLMGQA